MPPEVPAGRVQEPGGQSEAGRRVAAPGGDRRLKGRQQPGRPRPPRPAGALPVLQLERGQAIAGSFFLFLFFFNVGRGLAPSLLISSGCAGNRAVVVYIKGWAYEAWGGGVGLRPLLLAKSQLKNSGGGGGRG